MNFISIRDKSIEDIVEMFKVADALQHSKKLVLKDKFFILFFPESSIRTRLSFEKGIQELGGRCLLFPPSTLDKRESLRDVVRYLENWVDGIVVRHADYAKVEKLAEESRIPVINAMTSYNHPCEILADIYSISKIFTNFKSLNYTFIGEKGNIANSWTIAAEALNLRLHHVCIEGNRLKHDDKNYTFHLELEEVLPLSNVILTDSLSEGLRQTEYIDKYQVTVERMNKCRSNAILNPCPPFFRGQEVSAEVIESKFFVGYQFKKNLIYVQQAIILYCLGIEL